MARARESPGIHEISPMSDMDKYTVEMTYARRWVSLNYIKDRLSDRW